MQCRSISTLINPASIKVSWFCFIIFHVRSAQFCPCFLFLCWVVAKRITFVLHQLRFIQFVLFLVPWFLFSHIELAVFTVRPHLLFYPQLRIETVATIAQQERFNCTSVIEEEWELQRQRLKKEDWEDLELRISQMYWEEEGEWNRGNRKIWITWASKESERRESMSSVESGEDGAWNLPWVLSHFMTDRTLIEGSNWLVVFLGSKI